MHRSNRAGGARLNRTLLVIAAPVLIGSQVFHTASGRTNRSYWRDRGSGDDF